MPTLISTQNLELMLLGGVDVRLNGVSVTGISYNKMRALLAYLAVEREQDHSREALAELLWRERRSCYCTRESASNPGGFAQGIGVTAWQHECF